MWDDGGLGRSLRRHVLLAMVATLALTVGLGGWAAATSISGAVVALGHLVVASHVKTIQHPYGGIISEILVSDGESVSAGQAVLRLDATQLSSERAIVSRRLNELAVQRVRLIAERDGVEDLHFPTALKNNPQSWLAESLTAERGLFQTRRMAREGQQQQLEERIKQYENEISGLDQQADGITEALSFLRDELGGLQQLRDKGLVTQQRTNTLAREAAILKGDLGEVRSSKAQAAGRIAETRLQILQINQELRNEVTAQLRENQAQRGELIEREIVAGDKLVRTTLRAPLRGIVHQMAVHTIGGVLAPGDNVMQIVPESDELTLLARIAPQSIDQVARDQTAIVRLSAFNQRSTPELVGAVTFVAADLSTDERNGGTYYEVRISIPEEERQRLGDLMLVAGMPGEVFIQTNERTVMSYLIKPLSDQIMRAFREQ